MNTALSSLINSCRICLIDLQSAEDAVIIENSIRNKFIEITGSELIDDPASYSNIICGGCYLKFIEFCEYRDALIESQNILYSRSKDEQYVELILLEENENENSRECLVKDSENETIVEHKSEFYEISLYESNAGKPKKPAASNKKTTCFICGVEISVKGFYHHLRRAHKIGKTFECDYCGKMYNLKNDLVAHMQKHLSKEGRLKYVCTICLTTLYSKTAMTNHLKTFHSDICEIHPCDVQNCDKSFDSATKLVQHKKAVHENGSYFCVHCYRYYSTKGYLQKHIKQCHMVKVIVNCGICEKPVTESGLRQHLQRHVEKEFKCTYADCSKTFQFKGSLSKHISNHHESPEAVKCLLCELTFPTVKHLNRHISRQHNNVRVKCEVEDCYQLFTRKDYLTSHIKSHKNLGEEEKKIFLNRVKYIKEISW